jgi:hypothetical protein
MEHITTPVPVQTFSSLEKRSRRSLEDASLMLPATEQALLEEKAHVKKRKRVEVG